MLMILINPGNISSQIASIKDKEIVIKTDAKIIRENKEFCNDLSRTSWPPQKKFYLDLVFIILLEKKNIV